MVLGLRNGATTLQRAMNNIPSSVKWYSALVYLEDAVELLKTVKDHMSHLRQTLTLQRESAVVPRLKSCSFLGEKINYIGHFMRPGKLDN